MNNKILNSFKNAIKVLNKGKILAYPTEAVFGLGCDPDNEKAIYQLLNLKQRSWKNGLILITSNYKHLSCYIEDNQLNILKKKIH